jgi:hypothetical protein
LLFKIGLGCLALALLLILGYAFAPLVMGENESVMGLLPIVAMLLIVLGGVIAAIGTLALLYEIATAKNDGQWKVIWIIAIALFGFLGAGAYMYLARKERKA